MQMKNDSCVSIPLLVKLALNAKKNMHQKSYTFMFDKLHKYLSLCRRHASSLFTRMSLNLNALKCNVHFIKTAFYLAF